MKSLFNLAHFAALTAMFAVCGCSATYYQTPAPVDVPSDEPVAVSSGSVDVDYFYDDLAPYGRWLNYPPYGWVWTPYASPMGWRPYSDGYWAYTDYGWSWVSYEPYGWATYHYGRWAFDGNYGWIWVPDTVWAPAWVAWQSGDGWVGWAPLPPAAHWRPASGIYFVDTHPIPPSHWCFVEGHHLSQTKLKSSIVSVAKNQWLLKRTSDKTRYVSRNGTPVNEGIDVVRWEKQNGRKATRLKVVDTAAPPRGHTPKSASVEYFRPKVRDENGNGPSREIREPELALSDSELRKQSEIERREMEDALAKERAELKRQHQKELQGAKKKAAADEIKKRQAAENQALEQHETEQREVLKERQEKKIVKVEHSQQAEKKQQGQSKGQAKQHSQTKERAGSENNSTSESQSPPKGKGR